MKASLISVILATGLAQLAAATNNVCKNVSFINALISLWP